ncbi:MAG: hypothetical protein NT154_14060 [Verrucomicrobia bacterium]|nr:hypothetical protein [Verrucomicrobiota bacterium]
MGLPVQDSEGNPLPQPNYDVRLHQSGDVWFLGAPGTPERIVTIPEGKALFFGLPGAEASTLEDPPFFGATEQEQRTAAKWATDHVVPGSVFFELDGNAIANLDTFRTSSPQFSFNAPTPWIFGATGGSGTSVADGYYMLLKPLPKGDHVVHCGGRFHFAIAEGDPFDFDNLGDTTFYDTADVSAGQPFGHVWFLGGSYSATPDANGNLSAVATRDVTIPAGTALFFPIFDSEASVLEGNGTTEAELRSFAQGLQDHAQDLTCTIDGRVVGRLDNYRVQSPLFTIGPLPDNNVFQASGVTAPEGTTTPSVSDGVFVMVAPLCAGRHTIHFAGAAVFTQAQDGFDFTFSQDITYHLTVAGDRH